MSTPVSITEKINTFYGRIAEIEAEHASFFASRPDPRGFKAHDGIWCHLTFGKSPDGMVAYGFLPESDLPEHIRAEIGEAFQGIF